MKERRWCNTCKIVVLCNKNDLSGNWKQCGICKRETVTMMEATSAI